MQCLMLRWAFLRWPVGDLMWRRGAIAIAGGALMGTIIGWLYLWLNRSRLPTPHQLQDI